MTEYRGGCHCGALRLTYRTDIDPAHWPLRHDGCSFCRRHGVVGTSDPAGEVSLEFENSSKVSRYRFAHKTAEFLICSECGVFVAALIGAAGDERAVINARVFEDISLKLDEVIAVHFDDETPGQRTERRTRNWTPVRQGGRELT